MLKRILIGFVVSIISLAGTPAMAAEGEKSNSWVVEQLVKALKVVSDAIILKIKEFITTITDYIKFVYNGLLSFFRSLRLKASEFFVSLLETLDRIWSWLLGVLETSFEWLGKQIVSVLNWTWTAITSLWDKTLELVMWIGETVFETTISCFDWLIGCCTGLIEWMIGLLPDMSLPGLDAGLDTFMSYGMLFDGIVPFRETLICFALYISVFLVVMIYRIIKSFLPIIAT